MLLTVGLALAGGCLDAHPLDQYGYVLVVGMDPGEKADYMYTFLLQKNDPESNSQKSGGFSLASAEADSFPEAAELISSRVPFQLSFTRVHLFVAAQELAREEKGLEELFGFSLPNYRIRDNASVFIALDSAYGAMEGLKNDFDPSLSRLQSNFTTYSKRTGQIPVSNVAELTEGMRGTDYDPVLPLCGAKPEGDAQQQAADSTGSTDGAGLGGNLAVNSEMATGLSGSALFSGGRMAGVLNGRNTQLLMISIGDFVSGNMSFAAPDGKPLRVQLTAKAKPTQKLSLAPSPQGEVTVHLAADILYPQTPDLDARTLEGIISQQLSKELDELFLVCRDLNTDPFGFGALSSKTFSSEQAWEAYDWKSAYAKLQVSHQVQVTLRHDPKKSSLE